MKKNFQIVFHIFYVLKTPALNRLFSRQTTLQPKNSLPFYEQLTNILNSRRLKTTHLRNKNIVSHGFAESIFKRHSSPCMDNVIKIADYLKISVDELVGRV